MLFRSGRSALHRSWLQRKPRQRQHPSLHRRSQSTRCACTRQCRRKPSSRRCSPRCPCSVHDCSTTDCALCLRSEVPRLSKVVSGVRDKDQRKRKTAPVQVCEFASLHHARNPDVCWPFLYSIQDDTVYVNRAKRTTKQQEIATLGEALL